MRVGIGLVVLLWAAGALAERAVWVEFDAPAAVTAWAAARDAGGKAAAREKARAQVEKNRAQQSAALAGLKIEGKTSDVTVSEADGKLNVTVNLTKIATGIDLRDEHTRKALETDKCPTTTLVVARDQIQNPGDGEEKSGSADGQLTLHCVTKPVKVNYKVKNTGGVRAANGSMNLNMKDFGIDPPTYAGVGVKPDVKVNVSFNVKDE